ncbi:sensor histidine kinase [Micromonospora sp. WMMC241]|uniref:sensor histidine kinase n=1 Tax=Micromonospora sp. WMMC241 TaxID=3015159 RepID=UPI0022B71939|nr:sensor histidine kinase [Micromonospora sp. WMMC241]MCZ7437890.1 sensor histidine kinase [Micromonospora sp. WMMC241]
MTDRLPARRVRDTVLTAALAYALGRVTQARWGARARRRTAGEQRERIGNAGAGREPARAGGQVSRAAGQAVAADERRRIAGELHDLVAHQVAAMQVLATGARRALHRDPGAADRAMAAVEDTGRAALRELHRLLRVLRPAGPAAELAPQPGLSGIATLARAARDAGLPVTVRTSGPLGSVPDGVALAAYRVVQEALTNVLRHAGPAAALVRLAAVGGALTVEVTDTGRGPGAPDRIGHGLVGMRERVALYGGILRTGAAPGGGFRVYARIPLDPAGAVRD